jgi:hypothetical protein
LSEERYSETKERGAYFAIWAMLELGERLVKGQNLEMLEG